MESRKGFGYYDDEDEGGCVVYLGMPLLSPSVMLPRGTLPERNDAVENDVALRGEPAFGCGARCAALSLWNVIPRRAVTSVRVKRTVERREMRWTQDR